MTDAPPSVRDSQSESTSIRSGSDDAGGSRPLALAGIGIIALSAALSGLAYGALPEQMRIHWTLGMGPYYGPEFVPTPAVLTGFPVLIAGVALGSYWLETRLRRTEGFDAVSPYYAAGMVATLGVLLAVHGALVLVSL
ncbi:hypothetical protein U4E84_16345 [Halorubrum sp. AD140]|uniref:hypothetical protein n=1 Tax=Halorubrum sp. AD140 TaxID=3050073 RepID=UPI002ACC737B|nr:hypothetical protein [Halorubrum sp. AD140]MDZ5812911.1 hypothetical protein [Halorubrum sp. AD140]